MSYLDNLFSLEGKWAIVTGAARGNGKAISEALVGAGSKVIMVDILESELYETASELNTFNIRVKLCDVTHTDQIENLMSDIRKETNKIDILVNNAGVTYGNKILEYTLEDWDKTYRVNLLAPFLLSQKVGNLMKEQRNGSIINITSLNSEIAFPNNPAYMATKGGLKQLTKSFALDLGKYGVRANNVGPGYFRTDMTTKSWNDKVKRQQFENNTMLGRWGEPKDLCGIVVFLASDASSYITGQDIYVDGGWLAKG